MAADFNGFFLSSPSDVMEVELIELSHPSFSKLYRIVTNVAAGITVTLEDNSQGVFEFYPCTVDHGDNNNDDLDQGKDITFGDLGEIMPLEDQNYANWLAQQDDSIFQQPDQLYPKIVYRTYRSDDLTAPMTGPEYYQLETNTPGEKAATLSCHAPRLNTNQTGMMYSFTRFPGLRSVT